MKLKLILLSYLLVGAVCASGGHQIAERTIKPVVKDRYITIETHHHDCKASSLLAPMLQHAVSVPVSQQASIPDGSGHMDAINALRSVKAVITQADKRLAGLRATDVSYVMDGALPRPIHKPTTKGE